MENHFEMRNCNLGNEVEIAPNVMLGYTYKGWKSPCKIGSKSRIHSGTVIYADAHIGQRFTCGHNVTIRAECNIGDRVVILHGSTLEGKIKIGKGVKIMANVYIPSQTEIGDMVFIGPGVTILNAKYPMRKTGVLKTKIGNNVVIGGGVTIGPGIDIGNNVFVGAGSVVTKDIPDNSLSYGVPSKNGDLPEFLGDKNDPKQIFTGLDLWDNSEDDSWLKESF